MDKAALVVIYGNKPCVNDETNFTDIARLKHV